MRKDEWKKWNSERQMMLNPDEERQKGFQKKRGQKHRQKRVTDQMLAHTECQCTQRPPFPVSLCNSSCLWWYVIQHSSSYHSTPYLSFSSLIFSLLHFLSLCASFKGEPSISPPLSVCSSAAVWQWDHSISAVFSFHSKLICASHLIPTHGLWLTGHLPSQVCLLQRYCICTPF